MPKKLTIEEINDRLKKVHGDSVVFDSSTYKGVDTKARFIYKTDGEHWNTPYRVLKGALHPEEAKRRTIAGTSLPVEEIVDRIKKVHGQVVVMDTSTYKGTKKEAIFNDIEYGPFPATVRNVMNGSRHPKHGRKVTAQKNTLKIEEIKQRCPDYIKIVEKTFISLDEECLFIDTEFGEYKTKPSYVLRGGGFHLDRASRNQGDSLRTSLLEIEKILETNNPGIKIVYETYKNIGESATFIDPFYGEWTTTPSSVFEGSGHPKRGLEKRRKTCLDKYKVDSPSKNRDVFLKMVRSSHLTTAKFHWKTGEELSCKASYECGAVDYLNANRIDFKWQPEMFIMPDGRGYIPDLYLVDRDVWVEIKGWMRPVGKEKWDWFKLEHPTAELWDKKKLLSMGIKVK